VEVQDTPVRKEKSKSLWAFPWQYTESLLVGLLVLLVGLALGVLTRGRPVEPLHVPYNVYTAFIYVFLLLFIYVSYRKRAGIAWLSSVPAALTAITLFAGMVLLLGVVPQVDTFNSVFIRLSGLSHLKTSWVFLITQTFFLTTLGMAVLKRCLPLSVNNLGFFLNHFGLFLILLAATLGAGDVKRLEINLLKEGNESNIGVSGEGGMYKLPFSLRLIHFSIDEYNPRIAIIDPHTGLYNTPTGISLPMADSGLKTNLLKWHIQVHTYFPSAMVTDSTLQRSEESGSCPAANVTVISNKDTVKGWISSGSYLQNPNYLPLDTNNVLALTMPEAKKYTSIVEVRTDSLKVDTITLEVNKPVIVKGWKIYQVNYDHSKGKWSSLSVLEAISDPWLKVVYSGIFMVMAGVIYLFWIGAKSKNADNT
jgi:hypothetical protein